ncbi:MAG: ATP-binding protein [Acidobacteria bacterium]|nr:ATP-binding protein [Acidobacteriota bacterium]
MGPVPPTLVGEVQSVSGSTVSVRLRAGLSSLVLVGGESYRVGQVGAFLRVPLGYSHLYGVCSQVGAAALPHAIVGQGEAAIDGRWLTLTLFGESLAGEFQRGVSQYPTFGDEVHLVTNDELAQIYRNLDIQVPLVIGTIASASGIEARIDLAKLVTRHSVVVGSSGAGKSNFVGVLLEAIATRGFGAARVLVLDPHGEYASAVGDNGRVFSIKPENDEQEPLYVPFWALPFDELMQTTLGDLNTSQDAAIREEVVTLKRATATHLPIPTPVEAITADSPIPFSVKRLWYDLDDYETRTYTDNKLTQIEPSTTVGDPELLIPNVNPRQALAAGTPFKGPRRGLTRGLELMRNRLRDSRYQFLFNPGSELTPNALGQANGDLDALVASWVGHDRPITVIDLSSAPADVLSLVTGTVLRIIYDALFWAAGLPISGREQPLLVVLEEAHLFLPEGADNAAQRTVATIAKEGRKYGVGLMLVTQRPSELDSTSISQSGTMIALRLTNQADRSQVTSTMPDDLADLAGLLPSLRTGEALIVGEAIPIPSRVRIPLATNKLVGSDADLAHGWIDEPRPRTEHYTTALANWRAQTGVTHPGDNDPGDHHA